MITDTSDVVAFREAVPSLETFAADSTPDELRDAIERATASGTPLDEHGFPVFGPYSEDLRAPSVPHLPLGPPTLYRGADKFSPLTTRPTDEPTDSPTDALINRTRNRYASGFVVLRPFGGSGYASVATAGETPV